MNKAALSAWFPAFAIAAPFLPNGSLSGPMNPESMKTSFHSE